MNLYAASSRSIGNMPPENGSRVVSGSRVSSSGTERRAEQSLHLGVSAPSELQDRQLRVFCAFTTRAANVAPRGFDFGAEGRHIASGVDEQQYLVERSPPQDLGQLVAGAEPHPG